MITSKRLGNKVLELRIRVVEVYRDFNGQQDPLIQELCSKINSQANMLHMKMVKLSN